MSIHFEGTRIVPLTLLLAKEFATMLAFVGERPIVKARITWLRRELDAGRFYSPRWAIAKLKGRKYRVNGQHSSAMLVAAGNSGPFPEGLQVMIDEFEVDSEADLAELFARFDPRQSVRTESEVVVAWARQFTELAGLKAVTITSATTAVARWKALTGKASLRMSPEVKRGLVGDHLEFVIWSAAVLKFTMLRGPGVLAAIPATYYCDKDAATVFWYQVAEKSHPSNVNATRALGDFIIKCRDNKSEGALWNERARYAKCIQAWNAWIADKTTDLKYYEKKPLPAPMTPAKEAPKSEAA
jgi:hypothetical protein